jgi:glycosyltransferase involved in cell wall biosynthesis
MGVKTARQPLAAAGRRADRESPFDHSADHCLAPAPGRDGSAATARVRVARIIARLNVGGPARHVAWLSAGLRQRGFDGQLIAGTLPPGEEDLGWFSRQRGVCPITIPTMSREICLEDLATLWKLYRLFVALEPEIVHTHTAKAGAVGRAAALLYRWLTPGALWGRPRRCRVVHTYHGHVFHGYYGRLRTALFLAVERWLARWATDRIVVISPQQYEEIHGRYRVGRAGQFALVPLGFETAAFAGWQSRRHLLRDELKAAPGEVLVGIVGRLVAIKNHRLFLQAAAAYQARYAAGRPRVRFVIIGDGPLRHDLEAEAEQLGLADDVCFTGMRSDPENFYAGLDVVALTSLNEGTPLSLLEAMANCRPVISTAAGGVVDLVGPPAAAQGAAASTDHLPGFRLHERGVLLKEPHPEALAQGLAELVTASRLREELGARGRQYVVENYSVERLVHDMAALYGELLGRSPPTDSAGEVRVAASEPSDLRCAHCAP